MRKTTIIHSSLALAVFLFTNHAFAISFGMYAKFGSGSGEAEYGV